MAGPVSRGEQGTTQHSRVKERNTIKEDWKMRFDCRKGPLEIQRPLMGERALRCDVRHTQFKDAQNNLDLSAHCRPRSPASMPLPRAHGHRSGTILLWFSLKVRRRSQHASLSCGVLPRLKILPASIKKTNEEISTTFPPSGSIIVPGFAHFPPLFSIFNSFSSCKFYR